MSQYYRREKRIKEWEAQKNCGIEITCGEFRTNAHSVVLSSVSDYFKANTKFNKHKWRISLYEKFVSSDALNDIINFSYTGRLEISTDRLQDVIATASSPSHFYFERVRKTFDKKCRLLQCHFSISLCYSF